MSETILGAVKFWILNASAPAALDICASRFELTSDASISAAPSRNVSSRVLILGAASGALGFRVLSESESAQFFDEPGQEGAGLGEPDPRGMRSAVGLVWRALVLWMILLLLLTAVAVLN